MMKGLTLSSLKKHYALIPLFVILGGGMVLSAAYLARLAIKNPDVRLQVLLVISHGYEQPGSDELKRAKTVNRCFIDVGGINAPDYCWRRKSNPEPWQEYADKRYKLVNINNVDITKYKEGRPEF